MLSNNNLLIVAHFSPNVGYAWNTISEYFLALGNMFLQSGSRAIICYPTMEGIPAKFRSTGIEVIGCDFYNQTMMESHAFIRRNRIGYLYLTDRPVFSFKYLGYRLAGIRWIVVHDRTSGERDAPGFFKRHIKGIINRYPLLSADVGIAISEFVRQRLIRVSRLPEKRTLKIWNGVDIDKFSPGEDDFVFQRYGIPRSRKIIFAYSRANRYKGIETLIDAARILVHENGRNDLFFLYCGDGPDLDHFKSLVAEKKLTGEFLCAGYSDAAHRILKGVHVAVVPSLWQEGFGLSVVEGMASGKPVVASSVGGIKEIITDSRDGYLIQPGDSRSLAEKIRELADDEALQSRIGLAARKTVVNSFNIEDKKKELLNLFGSLMMDHSLPKPYSSLVR
jgi:glycosyltransferase involved in cell wall biosynthesis